MRNSDTLAIMRAWVDAVNQADLTGLLALSGANVEVVGPRGSGFGHQLLRDWLARARLVLRTHRAFARGDAVVLEQFGTWRDPDTGTITGERPVASAFRVADGRVVWFARFDELGDALSAVELDEADAVSYGNQML